LKHYFLLNLEEKANEFMSVLMAGERKYGTKKGSHDGSMHTLSEGLQMILYSLKKMMGEGKFKFVD